MNAVIFGILAGLGFGTFAVVIMLPMSFENKRQALLAAFASRFAIGFIVPNLILPMPMWAAGALAGLLASLSDAIVTKTYAPILVTGTLGGALIGYLTTLFI